TYVGTRGVKLSSISFGVDMDPSVIDIPSISQSYYVKEAGYGELGLAKVFNLSAYFFTFPISLQRESLYAKYRYYDIKSYAAQKYNANETRVGLTLSTVLMNSLPFPLSFEYIHNDATFVEDTSRVRVLFGASF
ncbi:MAG: hypothetical protein U9N39_05980, partial [Campylobacterota bacterium]|nr:hypothetical protein [Campylobacterota bacterium]